MSRELHGVFCVGVVWVRDGLEVVEGGEIIPFLGARACNGWCICGVYIIRVFRCVRVLVG